MTGWQLAAPATNEQHFTADSPYRSTLRRESVAAMADKCSLSRSFSELSQRPKLALLIPFGGYRETTAVEG
jgi:hypothetical protein